VLVIVVGGCFFDGGYGGASVRCSDGQCPSGLVCHLGTCVTSIPIDTMEDGLIDAPPAALTCADPGPFPAAGGTTMGTTVGRPSKMSSMCGGFVMNGPDAVYRITMSGGAQLRVTIDGGRKAYVIAGCVESPSTPVCLGNAVAAMGAPILVTPAAGPAFVVVDDENAASSSTYALTLTVL